VALRRTALGTTGQVSTLVLCVQEQALENQAAKAAVAAAEEAAAAATAAAAAATASASAGAGAGAGDSSAAGDDIVAPKSRRSGVNQQRKLLMAPEGVEATVVTRGALEDRIRALLSEADTLRSDMEVRGGGGGSGDDDWAQPGGVDHVLFSLVSVSARADPTPPALPL
jgi:hypothetical protein